MQAYYFTEITLDLPPTGRFLSDQEINNQERERERYQSFPSRWNPEVLPAGAINR